eukprot:TRINITY_DN113992_c0_g1_i1.p1 TRINITY_DN113992_c0_g1~~TRINITY_DN113992_c0_g1_i1.p1  ORF type:complete len:213 (+),score=11.64 TRINITY_DN113992_c0_g1_i1:52-690(+)
MKRVRSRDSSPRTSTWRDADRAASTQSQKDAAIRQSEHVPHLPGRISQPRFEDDRPTLPSAAFGSAHPADVRITKRSRPTALHLGAPSSMKLSQFCRFLVVVCTASLPQCSEAGIPRIVADAAATHLAGFGPNSLCPEFVQRAVQVAYIMHKPSDERLDWLELFSGKANLSKKVVKAGFRGASFDRSSCVQEDLYEGLALQVLGSWNQVHDC